MRVRMYACLIMGLLMVPYLATGRSVAAQAQQLHPGEYSPADIQYGSRLFAAQCSNCHGPNGDALPAANLRGQLRRARSDAELSRLITNGIAGAGMPSHKFSPPDMTALVAYVRNMASFDSRSVPLGDAERGKTLFAGKGACTNCHRVAGTGRRLAPDLTAIGAARSPGAIERSLLDPNAAMLPFNRSIRAVTKDGKVITGRRLNEDTYTVQILDDQDRLLSLDKADLREFSVVKTSPMASYKDKLTEQERADLLAYLVNLKGI